MEAACRTRRSIGLLEKYQLKAEECIFVDDLKANAEGHSSGFTIQFISYEDE
ncbi:MAG: hypothetical protein ACLTSZ_19740 [Lachnospiraceae bacterium]